MSTKLEGGVDPHDSIVKFAYAFARWFVLLGEACLVYVAIAVASRLIPNSDMAGVLQLLAISSMVIIAVAPIFALAQRLKLWGEKRKLGNVGRYTLSLIFLLPLGFALYAVGTTIGQAVPALIAAAQQ